MSIRVDCPNGHHFRVKDKYAGKKGLCPHCEGEVVVRVPDVTPDEKAAAEWTKSRKAYHIDESDESLVYDDPVGEGASGSGQSLVGASAIKHGKTCPKCGDKSPIWYATCQKCGEFFGDS